MKCELCHEHDAEVAISVNQRGGDEELYVCKACAAQERSKKQRKSQRTRKVSGLLPGLSMSITEVSGGEESPIIESLMDAVGGLVQAMGGLEAEDSDEEKKEESSVTATDKTKYYTLPCARIEESYRIGSRLHLEGLHLVGEMEDVQRALQALDMRLVGLEIDGVRDVGHAYEVQYACSSERAKRVVKALLHQESNARKNLMHEWSRVWSDAICRALAILKNCRLLSAGELFDILSPLRIAAQHHLLEGITYAEIKALAGSIDLTATEFELEPDERDRLDASRADEMNARFEEVLIKE